MSSKKSLINHSNLPELSGIYRFYNADNELIYVGKAKNIKKRVASYFTKTISHNRKTQRLVSETRKIEYTVSDSEFDALLLENNFIKQHQPRYNILLKDDKTFPYICVLKEAFPRIISTRKYNKEAGEYFGPYSSVMAMKNILELIQKLYRIRTCNLLLSDENIQQKKFKVCLEYHLGNCLGPCEGLQQHDNYLEEIEQARNILKGKISIVKEYFTSKMKQASEQLAYEKASYYKSRIDLLEKFQLKSTVVNQQLTSIDVFSIISDSHNAYLNYLQIKEGAIVFSKNFEVKKRLDEQDEDILSSVAEEVRQTYRSDNTLILSNIPLNILAEGIINQVPQIGDKKKLLLLSLKNIKQFKQQKEIALYQKKEKIDEAVIRLKNDLRLENPPLIIECFDNSNFMGSNPVASMVQFKNGKPNKTHYRHFNIKTVSGPNDFASMEEIVQRRYSKLLNNNEPLPDLIVIDGGQGQLSSACTALKQLNVYGKIPIIGIAKRLEEIYFPEDSIPIHLSKKSPSIFLLQRVRDEAHRFAINFHRKKRSKTSIETRLNKIEGIGKSTEEKLLKVFKSWERIKKASEKELEEIIGPSKAARVYAQMKKEG